MPAQSARVVVIFVLFCANSLIRAGTQRLAEGPQHVNNMNGKRLATDYGTAPNTAAQAAVAESANAALPSLSNFIDSGQTDTDSTNLRLVKRAPIGFLGMRGKKATPTTTTTLYDMDAAAPSYWNTQYAVNLNQQLPAQRFSVPSQAADYQDEDYYTANVQEQKRGPVGFLGMRGKKDLFLDELRLLEVLQAATQADRDAGFALTEKRVPSSGFMGMRGKRNPAHKRLSKFEYDDSVEVPDEVYAALSRLNSPFGTDYKRAPSVGFMGMRGKKVPLGFGLFGTRGKKVPVDFRGKFVGVRGKKVPVGMALRDLVAARGGEYTMPELQSGAHLETGVDGESSKRAPSGFHGMRGKKWSSSSPLQTDGSSYD